MGSTEIRSQESCVITSGLVATNAGVVDASDTGAAAATTEFLVLVGGTGEPKQIYITSIYANATVAGTLFFYQRDAADAWAAGFVAGDTNQVYSIHIPVGGAGITGVNIGPITADLSACALTGSYVNTNLGEIAITYDYV